MKTHLNSRLRRMTAAALVSAALIGGSLVVAAPAHAGLYGPPVKITCGAGYNAQLKVRVTLGTVRIGWGRTSSEAGHATTQIPNVPINYREMGPGTHRINMGWTTMWWQQWADPGTENYTYWHECVRQF